MDLSGASDHDGSTTGWAGRLRDTQRSGREAERDTGQGAEQWAPGRWSNLAQSQKQRWRNTGRETSRQGGPEMGADGPTAGQTDLPLPLPASHGLPISWASHPLRQQQQSSLIPLALAPLSSPSLPQSLLQSSPLFKMSFCSCSPDSCAILEPVLGPGGWVLEGCPCGQPWGGGTGGWRAGVTRSSDTHTHTPHPGLPPKLGPHTQHPQEAGHRGPSSRAFHGSGWSDPIQHPAQVLVLCQESSQV